MENASSAVYSAPAPEAALALRHGPPQATREALLAARRRTLAIAQAGRAALGAGLAVPYAPERNPPLWELGHVAWFQEWWIARNPQRALGAAASPGAKRGPSLLPDADRRFDSSHVPHRPRWELALAAQATLDYLARTLEQTLALLDDLDAGAGDAALYFFRLAALHEEMHCEAAVYMAHGLGIPVPEAAPPPHVDGGGELSVPAQRLRLGADAVGFAFDNEQPAREIDVAAFTIDAEPVAWQAFLPFVEAGGYERPEWWTAQGSAWLAAQPQRHPVALRQGSTGWEQVRHGAWRPVQPRHAALHLNLHEAQAWCRWAGRSLPTEAQWECAALAAPGFRWGHAWEWTASVFEPYPGFAPHPYRDYSQPWFHTRQVLRGAAPATSPALAHARYRNFFEPHRRDIFAGFRSAGPAPRPAGTQGPTYT